MDNIARYAFFNAYRFGEESEFNWKDLFPTNSGFVATPDDEGFNRVSGPRLRRSVDPSHN